VRLACNLFQPSIVRYVRDGRVFVVTCQCNVWSCGTTVGASTYASPIAFPLYTFTTMAATESIYNKPGFDFSNQTRCVYFYCIRLYDLISPEIHSYPPKVFLSQRLPAQAPPLSAAYLKMELCWVLTPEPRRVLLLLIRTARRFAMGKALCHWLANARVDSLFDRVDPMLRCWYCSRHRVHDRSHLV
jgi:hypothetical protein